MKDKFIVAAVDYMTKYRHKTMNVSSFGGVWSKDGVPVAWGQNYPCHSTMSDIRNAGSYAGLSVGPPRKVPELVFSWSKSKGDKAFDDPAFKTFTSWLVSAGSPYRSLWSKTPEGGLWINGVDVTSDKFCQATGFIFPDLEVPANLLVNFMIMARQPHEHPAVVESWYGLVQAGADPTLSVIFAHQIPKVRDVMEVSTNGNPAHCAIDPWSQVSPERISNFCRGVIAQPNENYSTNQRYQPCNAVFETRGWQSWDNKGSYYKFITERYVKLFGTGGTGRMFNTSRGPQALTITLHDLVELINTEAKRIANV